MDSPWMAAAAIAAGLALLVGGGEMLVRGASSLARFARIPPLVIGLTVVAFGTSAPELAVSLRASLGGSGDIALGNVVGSNICNVLLILGASALIRPLAAASRLVRIDVPLVILASAAALLAGLDGRISRIEGAAALLALAVHVTWLVLAGRAEAARETEATPQPGSSPDSSPDSTSDSSLASSPDSSPAEAPAGATRLLLQGSLVLVGLALLVVGARLLVDAATSIARLAGVSELVIGLTVVAVGTSLPELATSIMAALRGAREIAVGNVIGSNLFNLLGVLGASAAVSAGGVAVPRSALVFDLPVMLAVAIACLPVFFTGGEISRWEGCVLLAYFVLYTAIVVFSGTAEGFVRTLLLGTLVFVVPLTALTLAVRVAQTLRGRRP